MDVKKIKRVLSVIFVALFTVIIVVFPSFSAIIQSQCKCHSYTNIYHDLLMQNLSSTLNISDIFLALNRSDFFLKFLKMDVRLQHHYTCLVAGPNGCGKTQFVKKLIEQGECITNGCAEKIFWLYGEYLPAYIQLSQKFPDISFIEGIPENLN